ncbi:MAG: hypothetical protein CFH16_00989 [Alphaproteobacteria bacterium MarineAlpha5_Bin6]|nr:MAG: hypothetical protein CFH17_00793 [Alphaproteobacteria bacterium MarineAlpha5_Bin7]PPR53476.1 MAG: hypothetical protein CFH16_00989 [Alphaproteobacteria bacterium MarineAlpha5_Bin6]
MFYWTIILFGILLMSISLSNPVYNLLLKKYIKVNLLFQIFIRVFLFIISLIIILLGLYVESKF